MLIAMRDRVGGLAGPLLVFALLIGSLMAGQFQRMRRPGVCLWITLLYAIVILFTLRIHLIIRPHLVSWAAVALLVMLLEDWQAGRRAFGRTLVAGTALLVIWTNLHGGFLLGLAIAGVYALDHGYQTLRGAHSAKFWQASCLLLVLGLGSLLNPWGWHLHLHLIAFLGNDFLMRSTTDFLPPIWANGTLPVLSLAVVAVVIPYSLRIRQVALKDWVLQFGLLYAAATSTRNIPFFGIVMLPIAARYLQQWLDASEGVFAREVLGSSGRLEEDEGSRNDLAWPMMVAG